MLSIPVCNLKHGESNAEMAENQCLPYICQCHGKCIIEVARNIMEKVDRSCVLDMRIITDTTIYTAVPETHT